MIKFFRKIRQRMLIENRFSKYLVYAIGEIILVMIGILLAIQVNNWNEEKKERGLEKSYLTNLKKDLERDKEGLLDIANKRKEKVVALNVLLEQVDIENPAEYPTDISSHFFTMTAWIAFNPNENAITEILSSGDLRIIQKQEIKDNLLELRNKYKELTDVRAHLRREYEEYIYNTVYKVDDFRLIKSKEGQRKYFRTVLQIPTFSNGMISARINQNGLIKQSEEIIDLIDQLLQQIEEELS